MTTELIKKTQRASSRRWPLIVVGLLSGHVMIMMAAATIATHDKSFAVVPDYYEKAINWDQQQAALRASRLLGWKLEIEPAEQIEPTGGRQVTFVLTNATGRAIENTSLNVEYFHDSHASHSEHAIVPQDPTDGRRFTGILPMRYAGSWEFHVTAIAGGKTFISDTVQTIGNGPAAHAANLVKG